MKLNRLLRLETLVATAVVLMEVLCVYPWVVWVGSLPYLQWEKAPLSLLSSLVILGATAYVTNTTLARKWPLNKARLATLGIALVLVLLLTRLEQGGGYALWDADWAGFAKENLPRLLGALGLGLYLLWRGIVNGRERLEVSYLYRNFAFGVGGLILLTIIWAATSRFVTKPLAFTTLGPYVVGYFFAALMALGLSNLKTLRKRASGTGNISDLLTRRWVLLLLSIVLVIVLVGTLIASTLSINVMTLILQALSVLRDWLYTAVLYVVLYPIGYLVTGLFYVVRFFLQFLRGNQPWDNSEAPDFGDLPEIIKGEPKHLPPELMLALKWTLLAIVVGVIIFFLAKALFRYWEGAGKKGIEEIHESLWSWEAFRADVKSFLRNLMAKLRKTVIRPLRPVPPLAATLEDASQPLDIRELYRGLLWEGKQAGLAKKSADTPYEYQGTLGKVIPGEQASLAALTEAYVRVRYGHTVIDGEPALGLVRQWLRLRSVFRSLNVPEIS